MTATTQVANRSHAFEVCNNRLLSLTLQMVSETEHPQDTPRAKLAKSLQASLHAGLVCFFGPRKTYRAAPRTVRRVASDAACAPLS